MVFMIITFYVLFFAGAIGIIWLSFIMFSDNLVYDHSNNAPPKQCEWCMHRFISLEGGLFKSRHRCSIQRIKVPHKIFKKYDRYEYVICERINSRNSCNFYKGCFDE